MFIVIQMSLSVLMRSQELAGWCSMSWLIAFSMSGRFSHPSATWFETFGATLGMRPISSPNVPTFQHLQDVRSQ